jgi:hypothetical protein
VNFVNETGFSANFARAQLFYRDLTLVTVVVKVSFDLGPDGRLSRVAEAEQLPVSEADVVTDLGTLDGDLVPIKPGCDVAILGHARSPRPDVPVDRVRVALSIGPFSRDVIAVGDRTWREDGGGLAPTPPVPFLALPLAYERAFGGSALLDGKRAAPYFANPRGRGYVALREHAVGTALPNIEESDQQLVSWEQAPLPAGMAPLPRESSLRMDTGGFQVDLENELVQLTPMAFSFAHPRMRLERYPEGAAFSLLGATHGGAWQFTVPPARFALALDLGDAHYELPLVSDTLCAFPDHRRFFVVARRALVYQFRPERPRSLRIFAGEAGSGGATTTIDEQRRARSPLVPIGPEASPEALPLPFDALLPLYPLTRIVEHLPLCPSG